MVKVRIKGEDTRKDDDGVAHVSWDEAQRMVTAGNAEILQEEAVVDEQTGAAEEPEQGYDSMTRDELDSLASDRGLTPGDYRTKADLIEALRG